MKELLTQVQVDALAPGPRDLFLWDTQLAGFGLKLTPAGRRVYVFQYRSGGRGAPTRRVTIGSEAQGWTAERARRRAEELTLSLRQPDPAPAGLAEEPVDDWQIRLGFIIADIARLQSALLRNTMKNLGGTLAQWSMLGRLVTHQGITQMELAERLKLSKVAVTGLVDRTVRAGWVERRLDKADRRVRRLYLTPHALAAVKLMREQVDIMTELTMGQVAQAEGRAALRTLDGIRQRLLEVQRGRSRHRFK
jgi:MarR family transcriptional regulator, transcriptional regulator for hemolysin